MPATTTSIPVGGAGRSARRKQRCWIFRVDGITSEGERSMGGSGAGQGAASGFAWPRESFRCDFSEHQRALFLLPRAGNRFFRASFLFLLGSMRVCSPKLFAVLFCTWYTTSTADRKTPPTLHTYTETPIIVPGGSDHWLQTTATHDPAVLLPTLMPPGHSLTPHLSLFLPTTLCMYVYVHASFFGSSLRSPLSFGSGSSRVGAREIHHGQEAGGAVSISAQRAPCRGAAAAAAAAAAAPWPQQECFGRGAVHRPPAERGPRRAPLRLALWLFS